MPSAITVIPPDGSNAVKANFRSNFTSAKAESEHGGFFTQKGQVGAGRDTGQVERQSEQRLNDLAVSVKDYGAVGDETSRPVSQWLAGGARDRGYANLAAIQVDYPHVTSLSDEIDWAAIQKALEVGKVVASKPGLRVVIPAGIYYLNKTVKLNFSLQLSGEGNGTSLVWTSAHTSGPCLQIKPTPDTATSSGCQISDMIIDATLVPTTNLTNHGIEIFNAVTPEIRRVYIMQPKACGILMGQTFFATVQSITIDRSHDTPICLRSLQVNNTDGFGDGAYCSNGNHFTDIFLQCNYHFAPNTIQRPRLIELYSPCEGNFFNNVQVQTGTYRLDDGWIYNGGFSNVIRNFYAYDGPGAGRTCTTSAGAGSVVRLGFSFMPNLVTGDRITATGITGITNGTLYTVTSVGDSEFIFDVTGTTYSGSPQTGRIVRGGNITATAAGNENRITCTCNNHNLYTGQTIVVAGITNGTGTQSVIRMDRHTFQIANSTFGGSTQTGTWTIDRPTTVIQFGDPSNTGPNGLKCVVENCRVVANHDDATAVYFCNFIGGASDNRIHRVINDQGGDLKPYLAENANDNEFFTDWLLPNLWGGSTVLKQFTGYGIDYSPRLMAKDFGTSPPGLSEMSEGQIAFSVVGGVGKLYYRVGSAIHVFTSGTGGGQAPITTG